MKAGSITCACLAGVCLSGCEWLWEGGGNNDTGGNVAPAFAPTYADSFADSFQAKMADGGVTGQIVTQNTAGGGTRSVPFKVEISPDYQTATVYINNSIFTLPADGLADASGGTYRDGTRTIEVRPANATTFQDDVSYGNTATGTFGIAVAGAETRPENLPMMAATYSGGWGFSSFDAGGAESSLSGGTWDANVDFAAASDQVDFHLDTFSTTDVGTMTASIDGNRFSGTVDFDDGTYSGDIAATGVFYGTNAIQVGGTLNGTVTDGTDEVDGIGIFFGSR